MPEQLLDWKGIWEEYMDWRNKAERHIGTLLPSHEAALLIERIIDARVAELLEYREMCCRAGEEQDGDS